ncbi:hypothetical protein [Bartonella melophagi]|uniref:Uncharacterized protein n=1 Tax=Bartonella melophagi K-2C TaxID=1094557 RepID=J0QZ84_9HYPH|nr:hypothetical protein [Bartonella melophagi]EJF88519.1 hypothetical protein ME3_01071 [Bartonella melophagi K-2C]
MMINTNELCDILSTSVSSMSKVNKALVQPKEGKGNQLREAFKRWLAEARSCRMKRFLLL